MRAAAQVVENCVLPTGKNRQRDQEHVEHALEEAIGVPRAEIAGDAGTRRLAELVFFERLPLLLRSRREQER